MKRIILLFCIFSLFMSPAFSAVKSAEKDGIKIKVEKVRVYSRIDKDTPPCVKIYVRVYNNTRKSMYIYAGHFTLTDRDGQAYSSSASTYGEEKHLDGVKTPSGSYNKGWIVFDTPHKIRPYKLIYDDYDREIVIKLGKKKSKQFPYK